MGNDPYYSTWKTYKRDRRILVFTLISFYPSIILVIKPLYNLYQSDWIFHGFVLIWLFVLIILIFRVTDLICPRCNKSFGAKWVGFSRFYVGYGGKHCINCGLEKWVLSDLKTKYSGA